MRNVQWLLRTGVLLSTFFPLPAQWLHYPTAGIPRTPDGKPNLSAPAPKTADGKPDLSGIWMNPEDKWFRDLTSSGPEAPMLPWAAALYKQRPVALRPSAGALCAGCTVVARPQVKAAAAARLRAMVDPALASWSTR